jgi:hypothetical protein
MPALRRINAAQLRAMDDAAELVLKPPDKQQRQLNVAIGDPQAPLDTFFRVLEHNGLLGEAGRLRPEVGLVSMGDHFDWGKPDERTRATEEGTAILSWLAAHPPDQVEIIFGNHDLVRVGELTHFTDESFAAAQLAADYAYQQPSMAPAFLSKYPMVASAEVISRSFACFDVKQRELVTRLLKKRRARLAVAPADDLLLVHAGVTNDALEALAIPARNATSIAAGLNRFLDDRVAKWSGTGPLDLSPLHEIGSAKGGEARGVLSHRPTNPAVGKIDRARRAFDPRSLPTGIVQVIGHITDKNCKALMGRWTGPRAPPVYGQLRGLSRSGDEVRYHVGLEDSDTLIFIDGGMNHVPPEKYQLFDIQLRQAFATAVAAM